MIDFVITIAALAGAAAAIYAYCIRRRTRP
jgi:hypothetical protein